MHARERPSYLASAPVGSEAAGVAARLRFAFGRFTAFFVALEAGTVFVLGSGGAAFAGAITGRGAFSSEAGAVAAGVPTAGASATLGAVAGWRAG